MDIDGQQNDVVLADSATFFGLGGITIGGTDDPRELTDQVVRRNFVGDIKLVGSAGVGIKFSVKPTICYLFIFFLDFWLTDSCSPGQPVVRTFLLANNGESLAMHISFLDTNHHITAYCLYLILISTLCIFIHILSGFYCTSW